jgi:hypothetical protein
MRESATGTAMPSPEEIARRAYQIYETEGRPHGRSAEHWRRAELELMQSRQPGTTTGGRAGMSRTTTSPRGSEPTFRR